MKKQSRIPIYKEIAATIAADIKKGVLGDGDLLPSERDLALSFRVSRASIRTALLYLQSSGLISMREKARPVVTALGHKAFFEQLSGAASVLMARPDGVSNFQEVRAIFECGLARYAARYASPKEVDKLARALNKNRLDIGNSKEFVKSDVEFHNIIAELPGNPIISALNKALSQWLMEQRVVSVKSPRGNVEINAYEGHRQIFEAIACHDVEAADRSMMEHLKTISDAYWESFHSQ